MIIHNLFSWFGIMTLFIVEKRINIGIDIFYSMYGVHYSFAIMVLFKMEEGMIFYWLIFVAIDMGEWEKIYKLWSQLCKMKDDSFIQHPSILYKQVEFNTKYINESWKGLMFNLLWDLKPVKKLHKISWQTLTFKVYLEEGMMNLDYVFRKQRSYAL